jgi:hypothetical protein
MDFSNERAVPTILSARQAASQLGHPLAALTGSTPGDSSLIEYGYANWPQLDMVLLTYPDPDPLRITTERRPPDAPELLYAAQSAMVGHQLNTIPTNASVDMETWLTECMTHAYALPARSAPTSVSIAGTRHEPVFVDDGVHAACAWDADGVRVTAAGPHSALTALDLHWWPDQP